MKRFISCAAFLAGCGGAAPAAEAPASTVDNGAGAGGTQAPQSVQHTGVPSNTTTRDVAGARNELDRAEAQISAATGDCATACRALASMERAAEHLCALDSGRECDHARERLAAAKERVRNSCGGCNP